MKVSSSRSGYGYRVVLLRDDADADRPVWTVVEALTADPSVFGGIYRTTDRAGRSLVTTVYGEASQAMEEWADSHRGNAYRQIKEMAYRTACIGQ